MTNKDKSINGDNSAISDEPLNGNQEDSVHESKSESDEIESLTYEELLDKKEELENLLLRSNADLDNAYKRTLVEVEKAHKYGIEKLLLELLPIIDSLEAP